MSKPLSSTCHVIYKINEWEIRKWTGSLGYQIWRGDKFMSYQPSHQHAAGLLDAYLNYYDPEVWEHLHATGEKGWKHYE